MSLASLLRPVSLTSEGRAQSKTWPTSAKVTTVVAVALIWLLLPGYLDTRDDGWRDCQGGDVLSNQSRRAVVPAFQQSTGYDEAARRCLEYGRAELACEIIRVASYQIDRGQLRMQVLSEDEGWVEFDPARLDWRSPPDRELPTMPDPWAEEQSEIMFLVAQREAFGDGTWDRLITYIDASCR